MYTSTNISINLKDVSTIKAHTYKEISHNREMAGGYLRLDNDSIDSLNLSVDNKETCDGLIAKLQELSDKLSDG